MSRTRLAVIGSPISHSKSPVMHRAAYQVLGLPWTYDAHDVTCATLGTFVASLDGTWRGLSLTMPLKRDVVPLLETADETALLTGVANTVLVTDDGLAGFNTDVSGIVHPLVAAAVSSPRHVLVLGAGATAGSAVAAAIRLGAGSITVAARDTRRATAVVELGERMGAPVVLVSLSDVDGLMADVVINTLPGGAAGTVSFSREIRQTSVLFDVIYDPWPTTIATSWMDVGGQVIPGIEMLLAQALRQVRVFVRGDPELMVERETDVIKAMRATVVPSAIE